MAEEIFDEQAILLVCWVQLNQLTVKRLSKLYPYHRYLLLHPVLSRDLPVLRLPLIEAPHVHLTLGHREKMLFPVVPADLQGGIHPLQTHGTNRTMATMPAKNLLMSYY